MTGYWIEPKQTLIGSTYFLPKIKNKAKTSAFTTSVQHCARVIGKKTKGIEIGKKAKLSLFTDNTRVSVETPEEYPKKLLEQTHFARPEDTRALYFFKCISIYFKIANPHLKTNYGSSKK